MVSESTNFSEADITLITMTISSSEINVDSGTEIFCERDSWISYSYLKRSKF